MRKIVYLFFSLLLISFVLPSVIKAQLDDTHCQYLTPEERCNDPACSPSWCYTTPTPDQTEIMEGKVGNPVLPGIQDLTGTSFLQKILRTGIVMVLITGSIVFFFILTSGGIKWLSSSGDKVKLESAQKQISSGLVGLAILLSSFAIIKLIETLFGIDLLKITLPTL